MKVIHHNLFDCSEPEKFDWSITKNYYKRYKNIINSIIDTINKSEDSNYILGLRASLICFALTLEIYEKKDVNKNSICNINNDRYYFVCDCNTIYLKQKENKDDH